MRGRELLELLWLGGGRKGAPKAVSSSQESCPLHLPTPDSSLCPAHQDSPFLHRLEWPDGQLAVLTEERLAAGAGLWPQVCLGRSEEAQEAGSRASWGRLGWLPLLSAAFSRLVAMQGRLCHLVPLPPEFDCLPPPTPWP